MRNTALIILPLLYFVLIGNISCLQAEDYKTLEIGASAPAFSLPGVDGKTYTLDNFRSSKVLIVQQPRLMKIRLFSYTVISIPVESK
jgi:hypothetical protein